MENTLLTRNIAEVLPSKAELGKKMEQGTIRIYHGIDPSGAQIHLGHAIVLWKLREFQDAGHKVILLIGDFTGMIGDPSDRSAARKKLTRKEVLENAKTYKEQIGEILKFDGENPAEFKFNSQWLSKLTFAEVVELASNLTVQQMLERDFFQERLKQNKPIHLHEFLYPLMQGYDSIALDVDVEIGGTDQTFNMLVGRTLMKTLKGKEKLVISVPLLEGLDGRKMSKSFDNFVAITDTPADMFGKIMSVNDNLVDRYFELTTRLTPQELQSIKEKDQHPMDLKKRLAWEIVKLYHGEQKANEAKVEFQHVVQEGGQPKDIPPSPKLIELGEQPITYVSTASGVTASMSVARRLIEQGGLKWQGEVVKDPFQKVTVKGGEILQTGKAGKGKVFRIKVK